jgi:hypothetical protein
LIQNKRVLSRGCRLCQLRENVYPSKSNAALDGFDPKLMEDKDIFVPAYRGCGLGAGGLATKASICSQRAQPPRAPLPLQSPQTNPTRHAQLLLEAPYQPASFHPSAAASACDSTAAEPSIQPVCSGSPDRQLEVARDRPEYQAGQQTSRAAAASAVIADKSLPAEHASTPCRSHESHLTTP